jgi:hypothetical protein
MHVCTLPYYRIPKYTLCPQPCSICLQYELSCLFPLRMHWQHHLVAPRDNKLAPRIYWYPGCANRELSGLAGKTVAAAQKMWGNTDAKGSFTTRTFVKHKVVEIHLGNQVRTSTL